MKDKLTAKTIFGVEIPSDWEVKELGQIVDEKRPISYGIVQTGENVEGGIRCIRVTDIIDGKIDKSNLITTTKEISDGYKRTLLKEGDLVLALRGKIGQVAKVGADLAGANLTRGVALIALKESYDGGFIKQQISSEKSIKVFERSLNGSALQELSIGILRRIPILLPKILSEQKAIAQVLSTWDEAITKTQALIAQKELRKKWLMQQLLTGKKRVKGFGGEWKENTLENLFYRVTRKNLEGNANVVTVSAQKGFIKQTDFFNKAIASETLDNYFLVKRGEFCYNKSYSNGYPWGAIKRLRNLDKAVVTTLYICFGIKDEAETDGNFFEHFFEANLLDRGLTQIAHEGGRAHGLLNVTPLDFFSLKFTIPNKAEQTAIAQILQVADKELQLLRSKVELLREQKKWMMEVLLTGKKRLKL